MTPTYGPTPENSAIFRPLATSSLFAIAPNTSPKEPLEQPSHQTSGQYTSPCRHNPPPPSPPPQTLSADRQISKPRRARFLSDPETHFAPSTRTDLGDDDSFSPDIVSGYHFNLPLAREEQPSLLEQHSQPEHDHRTDGVYDDLDDIGEWVANTTAPHANDLTKKLAKAVSRGNALGNSAATISSSTAVAVADSALAEHRRVEDRRRENHARDKLDRATVEQVLDPRTRMILFRLLSRNRLRTLDGCVSTGKEANVYYATAASDPSVAPDADGDYTPNPGLLSHDVSPDAAVAVKVFKTSILQFKDRERYVAGEFRFRRSGYQRGSNRKMIQQWAEKEFRNQLRLQEAGIPAPIPLLLKPPVLIMSFFGRDGWSAPRLKDANLSASRLAKAYFRVCMLMRRMFRIAHLVHGDLSEYNMLYWKGEIIIIDVSQSVEDDHPMALDFLRRDCANVNEFFRRSGAVAVLSVREMFDFVTGEHIGNQELEEESALGYLLDCAASRDAGSMLWTKQDDEVFMRSYIPRTLQDVDIREQQFSASTADELDQNLFAKLTGLAVTQKRERSSYKAAKSPVVSNGTQGGPMPPVEQFEDVHVDVPNLEVPCVEPATVRTLPTPETVRVKSSSPCTSNSTRSSRPNCEEHDANRYPRLLEEIKKIDSVQDGCSARDESAECTEGTCEEDEGLTEHNGESKDSEDLWMHKAHDSQHADRFMGFSKKEWKKRVKVENREKRENKVPKHVKKRKEALAKRRRGTK